MRQTASMAVERVRGMNDIPSGLHAAHARLAAEILTVCARAGYDVMDFPVIESTELFLRKAGEERVQQMYAFRYRNRDLCLRPEFTASVVRSTIATMQSAPLPMRVAYHGPVFRYERPGQARYRQFTEVGIELLGAATAAADAEVIGTAATALRAAGLPTVRIVLGHVGIVRGFLAGLALDERVREWLVWSMERLRPDDPRGERIHPALAAMLDEEAHHEPPTTIMPPDRDAFLSLLRAAGISLDGHRRTPEEIAEGLIRKMARRTEGNDVRRALDFLRRLVMLRGAPAEVFPQLEALLTTEHMGMEAVARLQSVIGLLGAYGIEPDQIVLDLGLGRGLHYYTGILFEVYTEDSVRSGRAEQLGGGGRYDDLATMLGARQSLPAVGFSLGIERIADALPLRERSATAHPTVVVGQGERGEMRDAADLAHALRAIGWTALLDVRDRTPNAAIKHARSIRAAVYAEPAADGRSVRWLPLNGEPERHIPQAMNGLPFPPEPAGATDD
ncbi:MAG: histidine--tRNA ligase family protein [Chloroflexota bacterium]|nr:histidine--tRNA ligase family protein [Chloroflexota bacterium]